VVIYARSGDKVGSTDRGIASTHIGNDSKWESETHGGTEFAALLVKASYQPEATRGVMAGFGGDVKPACNGPERLSWQFCVSRHFSSNQARIKQFLTTRKRPPTTSV
jgi:hypothetical protein